MELLLSHPSGFSLEHARGQRLHLRFQERDLLGPLTFTWDLSTPRLASTRKPDAAGRSWSALSSTGLELDQVEYPDTHTARLRYRSHQGFEATLSLVLNASGLELLPTLVLHGGPGDAGAGLEAFRLLAEQPESSFLAGCGQAPGWNFFPLAYNSFSPAYARDSREVLPPPRFATAGAFNQHTDSIYWKKPNALSSAWMAMMARHGRPETLLLGWLTARQGLGEIALLRQGPGQTAPTRLEARLGFEGRRLEPGERVLGDTLELAWSTDPSGLLEGWIGRVAQRMQARVPAGAVPSGWCSWYHYYTAISEAELARNLEALLMARHQLPVRCIQLDDGYQTAVGDWLSPNKKFPSGLEALARRIADDGYLPGLWTAPFLVQRSSRIFQAHPDWILKTREGKLERFGYHPVWGLLTGQVYCLDPTHPEVLSHLSEVYSRLKRMGFRFFKIDFLNAGLRVGRHHDAFCSPVEAYRRGLECIRAAVGEDAFILGCGAPLLPAIGVVDGMRISSDVKEAWDDPTIGYLSNGNGHPAAELSILNSMTRSSLHGRWWFNDPDCLLVRAQRSSLKLVEVQTLLSVLSLTGGMLMLSDDLSRLEPARKALAELALPPLGTPARALGLLEEARPRRFVRLSPTEGGTEALAVVLNWGERIEEPQIRAGELGLPDGRYHAFEFWSRSWRVLEPGEGLPVVLDPHECALVLLRPCLARPQLISVLHHLGQTTALLHAEIWDDAAQTLIVQLQLGAERTAEVWVAVPSGWRLVQALGHAGAHVHGHHALEAVAKLEVHLRMQGRLELAFERWESGEGGGPASGE